MQSSDTTKPNKSQVGNKNDDKQSVPSEPKVQSNDSPKSPSTHEIPIPASSSPVPSNGKTESGSEKRITPAGTPNQSIGTTPNSITPSPSEIPYEPLRPDKKPTIVRPRTASEILRRAKEIEDIKARRRQRDDEEKETENQTVEQDQPYVPPCEVCYFNAAKRIKEIEEQRAKK